MRLGWVFAATVWTGSALSAPVWAAPPESPVDPILERENAARKLRVAPELADLPFLRRLTVDLIGRIPTEEEARRFQAWPADQRVGKAIDALMAEPRFADRWAVFFADLLRVRSNADGGGAFLSFVHRAVSTNMPYDVMARQLISAGGRANTTPEVGFVLGDAADPMALAGVTSQVFMGVRISCAQCHNHPFDVWTRKQFYGLAAYFGKTHRVESRLTKAVYLNETEQTSILWPPEDKTKGVTRAPMTPAFPFPMDEADGPRGHIARLTKMRADEEARRTKIASAEPSVDDLLTDVTKKLDKRTAGGIPDALDVGSEARNAARDLRVEKEIYKASALRNELARLVTDPRNRLFSRNLVNRVWADLMGTGFVEPVDDFRNDNTASHPATLDYLAEEFVGSGFDFRSLVKAVVSTKAYRRAHLPPSTDPIERREAERAFTAAPVRRMLSETLYDSIVQAGNLFEVKHQAGENLITVMTVVREPVMEDGAGKPEKKVAAAPAKTEKKMMPAPAPAAYDLERGIGQIDFEAALKRKNGPAMAMDAMQKMSVEEIEAMQAAERPGGKRAKFIERMVESVVDDNPKFASAMRMASPAPPAHFLRVFGQPPRDTLDEKRDASPSMRQALMMLNGKLTHEASRVGTLEPLHPLLAGPKPDFAAAVKLAYLQIITREPTAVELEEGVTLIREGGKPLDGMADLRWALFNSHEFRFLP